MLGLGIQIQNNSLSIQQAIGDFVILESGDFVLAENGDNIIIE